MNPGDAGDDHHTPIMYVRPATRETLINRPSYGSPGCSFACQKTHYCGDGILDPSQGEQCEPFPGYDLCMRDCSIFIGP